MATGHEIIPLQTNSLIYVMASSERFYLGKDSKIETW